MTHGCWEGGRIAARRDPAEIASAQARAAQFKRNLDWKDANAKDVLLHRGKYYCVAGQELFVGDDISEVMARAKLAHPDDLGRVTGVREKIGLAATRLRRIDGDAATTGIAVVFIAAAEGAASVVPYRWARITRSLKSTLPS